MKMSAASWTQIKLEVEAGVAEAVANFLLELGSPGLEVEEQADETTLKGYVQGDASGQVERLSQFLRGLEAMGLTGGHRGPEISALVETDWSSGWRSRFHAFRVGRRLLIKPSWEAVEAGTNQLVITVDPQMAFGTGEHATTRFCLRCLEELVREGNLVLDVGTGSGILAIAAVKLGAKGALGLDIDPQAIATARENARTNGVSRQVAFSCSLLDHRVPSKSFHQVVANITSQVLLPLLPELRRVTKAGGHIILAGFLAQEKGLLRRGLSENGLRLCRLEDQGEWVCAVAQARGM